jgi:opacity protein-like surface antigen
MTIVGRGAYFMKISFGAAKIRKTFSPLLASLSLLVLSVSTAQALSLSNTAIPPSGWFAGAGIAGVNPSVKNNTLFASSGMPEFPDDMYVTHYKQKTLVSPSLIGGYQWQRCTTWLPAYSASLNYTYLPNTTLDGVIYQNSLADAKNFTFKYNTSEQTLMLKLKADLYRYYQFMPYVSVGAGFSRNRVNNYSDTPIPGETIQEREDAFGSATNTQFAKSIGAGVDFWLGQKVQASLGYEYTNYGDIKTSYGSAALANNRLTNKVSSNAVGLQVVYFF